ncbi:hypothetical protein [Mesorhizobium sp. Cs1299R1N3]|uniref:hypothetical protein n=1 Tax=Mesorhizobium sp. Cs1299R1N3 TaxID=3015173 RepID=UPI00301CAA63
MDTTEFKSRAGILATLFDSFPDQGNSAGLDRGKAFIAATADLPIRHLSEAVKRFMRGEVEGQNRRFCPSTAELCAEARRLVARDRYEDHKRKLEAAPKPKVEAAPVVSAEQRAAVQARLREKFPGLLREL